MQIVIELDDKTYQKTVDCKMQIAANKTDAEKLDRCPRCKAKFEESKVQE